MPEKITLEYFLKKSKEKHGDTYNYSHIIEIKNSSEKIPIRCKKHGIFIQNARNHYKGCGCPICGYEKVSNKLKMSSEEFINKSSIVHNYKYRYGKVIYKDIKKDVCILCPEHGYFWQTPETHLNGSGCRLCAGNFKGNAEQFIKKAVEIHKYKYIYELVKYVNAHTKIKIICKKHGIFEQRPNSHLNGNGCPFCKKDKLVDNNPKTKTTEEFIKQAKKIHGDLYDYSNTIYKRDRDIVSVICKKHGLFNQVANVHINGCGCPICNNSKGEIEINKILKNNNINFIQQKKFKECFDTLPLPFDFYLPDINTCIEYDGEQHYKPIKIFGGVKRYTLLKKHDEIKNKYCHKKGIRLIRITFKDNIYNMLSSIGII